MVRSLQRSCAVSVVKAHLYHTEVHPSRSRRYTARVQCSIHSGSYCNEYTYHNSPRGTLYDICRYKTNQSRIILSQQRLGDYNIMYNSFQGTFAFVKDSDKKCIQTLQFILNTNNA